ncbi:MAG: NADH-quinone oxidoreductase subunit H [Verrucomicrobia bacterium]|nr:NADH-quinone oxidoreductase subunit H [Verrucomicrobiota bacterium]
MNPGVLLAAAGAAILISILGAFRAPRGWLATLLAGALAAAGAATWILTTGSAWEWRSAFLLGGQAVHLRLDGVSALFLALLAVVGGAAGAYSREYWADAAHSCSAPRGRAWWSALLLFIGLVLLSSNGLHFLIAWELFAVSAFFLITLDARRREVRAAGWLYLAASHTGTLALFAFFSLLATRTGNWDLGPMRNHTELAPLFWLALFGFGVKAGMFPLHIWLPSAHANAPSHVSAILSGVAIKMGIYGIVRFSGWMPVPDGAGWLVAGVGVVSAVLGVAFALGQHDLKRLLAYHSVENIGIILMGVGFALVAAEHGYPAWGALALAGGLLHVWNHGLFKALLFLGAGSVLHATGTREMSRLGGLWRAMPWTASLFALGAAAISGLPPLNGFVSEWLVYLGLFDAVNQPGAAVVGAIPAIVLLAVTGALALACFVKVCGVVFLGAPRSHDAEHAHECGGWMRGAMLVLAAGCVAIGLAPFVFWLAVHAAVAAWRGIWADAPMPESLATLGFVHMGLAASGVAGAAWLWWRAHRHGWARGLTWDCGYAAPTARMQYTAGSFAGIITEWFSWILLPERHEHRPTEEFPQHAEFEEHTPETVLERVIEPVARLVMWASGMARRLQHGRTHAYILYLILGLIAVAVMAVSWSR